MTTYVTAPTGQDVADYLGRGDDTALVSLAGAHVGIITSLVLGYTRGRGFSDTGDPAEDLAAVITTATARLAGNPELVRQFSLADYSESRTVFNGWTLPETMVLNRYRRRSA